MVIYKYFHLEGFGHGPRYLVVGPSGLKKIYAEVLEIFWAPETIASEKVREELHETGAKTDC